MWLRVGRTQPDGLLADVRLRNQEITTRSTAKLQKFAVPKRTETINATPDENGKANARAV